MNKHRKDYLKMQPTIEAAVYDPSNYKNGQYWQWWTVQPDDDWDAVMALINQGWPKKDSIDDKKTDTVRYGILKAFSSIWIYRIYYCGKDKAGRTGRYFVLLLRMSSPEEINDRSAAGLVKYFEEEQTLPLKVPAPGASIVPGEPDSLLRELAKISFPNNEKLMHIGLACNGAPEQFQCNEVPRKYDSGPYSKRYSDTHKHNDKHLLPASKNREGSCLKNLGRCCLLMVIAVLSMILLLLFALKSCGKQQETNSTAAVSSGIMDSLNGTADESSPQNVPDKKLIINDNNNSKNKTESAE